MVKKHIHRELIGHWNAGLNFGLGTELFSPERSSIEENSCGGNDDGVCGVSSSYTVCDCLVLTLS